MAKKNGKKKSVSSTGSDPVKDDVSGRKKGIQFHGVGAEVFNKEMEKRRGDAKVKPAVFPVIERDEASVKGEPVIKASPWIEKPSREEKRKRGRPPVAVKKKQYTLTLHPEVYEIATTEAQKRGISFSALVTLAIKKYLGEG